MGARHATSETISYMLRCQQHAGLFTNSKNVTHTVTFSSKLCKVQLLLISVTDLAAALGQSSSRWRQTCLGRKLCMEVAFLRGIPPISALMPQCTGSVRQCNLHYNPSCYMCSQPAIVDKENHKFFRNVLN